MKTPRFQSPLFSFLALLPAVPTSRAQIFYIAADNQGNGQPRQINGNGTGNTAIPLPFTSVGVPNWSRDGSVLALTAVDPAARGQRSTNVFALTPATGALTQLTNYTDIAADGPGHQPGLRGERRRVRPASTPGQRQRAPPWRPLAGSQPPPANNQPVVSVVGTPARGGFVVSRRADAAGPALAVVYHNGGSANRGVDYVAFSGSLNFAAGQTEAIIPVQLPPGCESVEEGEGVPRPGSQRGLPGRQSSEKVFLSDLR